MRQGRARGRPWHWLLPLFIAAAAPAAAAPAGPGEFPTEQVRALGPLLRQADTALLEADETGAMKRITVMSLAAAPPDLVRDVVVHPERYPEFVRNMKVSTVQRRADGSLDHTYELNYSII